MKTKFSKSSELNEEYIALIWKSGTLAQISYFRNGTGSTSGKRK